MRQTLQQNLLAWLLAAFFVVGGLANVFPSEQVRNDYLAWGYPHWFHYVTALLELTTSALLALPRYRLIGSLLGALVMISAAATLLFHGSYSHSAAPVAVLLLLTANARVTLRNKAQRSPT